MRLEQSLFLSGKRSLVETYDHSLLNGPTVPVAALQLIVIEN